MWARLSAKPNKLGLLGGMEPPEHNDLSPDYLHRSLYEDGQSALKKLGNALKDFVRKHASPPIGEGSEVEWMKDFFSDPAGDGVNLILRRYRSQWKI